MGRVCRLQGSELHRFCVVVAHGLSRLMPLTAQRVPGTDGQHVHGTLLPAQNPTWPKARACEGSQRPACKPLHAIPGQGRPRLRVGGNFPCWGQDRGGGSVSRCSLALCPSGVLEQQPFSQRPGFGLRQWGTLEVSWGSQQPPEHWQVRALWVGKSRGTAPQESSQAHTPSKKQGVWGQPFPHRVAWAHRESSPVGLEE